jgi:cytochrome P450
MAQAQRQLASIDVSDPLLYQDDSWRPLFAQLRRDDPVHYCEASPYGPYWSVTRYDDIFAVELDHETYSSASELGGIQVADQPKGQERPNFIRMDPPGHTAQRKTVAPIVAPTNLANFDRLIRERTCAVLDALPRGDIFDWAERVSIDLTNMMLATLFRLSMGRPDEVDMVVGRGDRQCQFAGRGGAFGGRTHRRADEDGRVFP